MTQKSNEEIPYRPLGIIVDLVKNLGFEVTHFHDDLIFIEHNAFLIQMGEQGKDVFVWFNIDCQQQKIGEIMERLNQQASSHNLVLEKKGSYELIANEDDETIQIEFIPL